MFEFLSQQYPEATESAIKLADEAAAIGTQGNDDIRFKALQKLYFTLFFEIEKIAHNVRTNNLDYLEEVQRCTLVADVNLVERVRIKAERKAEDKAADLSGNNNELYNQLVDLLLPYYIKLELVPFSPELDEKVREIRSETAKRSILAETAPASNIDQERPNP